MSLQMQFILQYSHFAIGIFSAFVFFAVFWLYFDAWVYKKRPSGAWKFAGFLLLSFSFAVGATRVEQNILLDSIFPQLFVENVTLFLRISGYISLIIGLLLEPLPLRPAESEEPQNKPVSLSALLFSNISLTSFGLFFAVPLSLLVSFLYFRKASSGFERHLKPISIAFFLLSISEILSLGELLQGNSNIQIAGFVAPFGVVWIVNHIILIAAILVLWRWVFKYLLKRIITQLFMIFTASIMFIFLISTVTFTMLLLKNLENDALSHLQTDVNILQYAIDSKKQETLSTAQLVAQNISLREAIINKDRKTIVDVISPILFAKKQSVLMVASASGQVLARAEDPARYGDAVSGDPLVIRGLTGEAVSSVTIKEGVIAPEVSIMSASPIRMPDNRIIGVVLAGTKIDNAFVDGVKAATKLDTSIYADNIRSATTFVTPDGKSRSIGIKEETPIIKKTVLDLGKQYVGSAYVLNTPYFAAYAPLMDLDKNPVGMIFVGQEQTTLLQTAGRSLELTFLIAMIVIVFSIIPVYLAARSIAYQLE